jgi:hypothetical protein
LNKKTKSKRAYRVVGIVFALLAIGYFVIYAAKRFRDIPPIDWNIVSMAVAFLSIGLITVSIGIVGGIWQLLLRDNNIIVNWKRVQIIVAISQFGKYLPGNVGQHVGRVFMARESGIPTFITINTMFIEILWGVGVGTGLSLLSLLFFVDATFLNNWTNLGVIELSLLFIVAVLLPMFGIRFINFFLPGIARKLSSEENIVEPRPLTSLMVSGLFLLNFLIIGVVINLQAHWIFGRVDGGILELTCLFAIAWIAGYLVPGAPAGLGVREVLMVLLLTPIFGSGTAIGLSITLRLTTTFGDALAFILGLLGRKYIHQ